MAGSCTCPCNFHNTKTVERNSKRKINEIGEQKREYLDHIDDNRTNSEELASVLRRSSRGNIVYSLCFVCEKDKLHHSKYGLAKHENLIRCGKLRLKKVFNANENTSDKTKILLSSTGFAN